MLSGYNGQPTFASGLRCTPVRVFSASPSATDFRTVVQNLDRIKLAA